MTNEEIERAARVTLAANPFLWAGSATGGTPEACRDAALLVLSKLMREAAAQAYDEAVGALESLRLSGVPATDDMESWEATKAARNWTVDKAQERIRALKDSLLSASASST